MRTTIERLGSDGILRVATETKPGFWLLSVSLSRLLGAQQQNKKG